MKSIQTKMSLVIFAIMIVVTAAFLLTATISTTTILDRDSEDILLSTADYQANIIDDNFRSTEQSVGTIYNYAVKRTETYDNFLTDTIERDRYTNDISELGKSIAENTRGAMAVYLRYNPDDYGASNGFWYTINLEDGSWQSSVPTDMSLYDKDDVEHVGWYYIPIEAGSPMWMDPYFNKNLGVEMISYIIPYYYGTYTVGIMGMDIDLDHLRSATEQISVYQSGYAFMMERDGDIIYHPGYPVGASFNNLPKSDREYFTEFLSKPFNTPVLYPSREGAEQKVVLKELRNGMILGICAPLNEINQPQTTLMNRLILLTFVILLFAVLTGVIWVRTIVRPLKQMTGVAREYAEGNLDAAMPGKGPDEVGVLSESLQTMATSLKTQIELADSANKAKSEFLANMSHEIRTPINAVLGMNEMILREAQDPAILEYSENIRSSGKTLLSLINSILDFSKIEDGKMELIPDNYDTANLIKTLVNSVAERAKAKELDFILNIDPSLPSVLMGDDVRVSQVIMNLLTNAVKYTPSGSVTFTVRGENKTRETIDLFVEVKDTGVGIKPEDMGRLFESFSRIDEKQNRNIEGTGLGMAIVVRLLHMMESELCVSSTYGEGSSFSFRLKQLIIDKRPIGPFEMHKDCKAEAEVERRIFIRDSHILVVDDNDMNLKVAKNLLKLFGVVPDLVASGEAAIEAMAAKTYHMVFLDHMMPIMDGIETLNILKERKLIKGAKIIALTANAVMGARETYVNEGFDDYLSKPIDIGKLEELLVKYMPADLVVRDERTVGSARTETPAPTIFTGDEEGDNAADVTHALEVIGEPMLNALREIGINVEGALKYVAYDGDFYKEMLGDYASSCQEKCEELETFYHIKDWDGYVIRIHALKSLSKTVGALDVSEKARLLEEACKAHDIETVERDNAAFIKAYKLLAAGIRQAAEQI